MVLIMKAVAKHMPRLPREEVGAWEPALRPGSVGVDWNPY